MPILLRNLTLGLDEPEETLLVRAGKRLGVPVGAIRSYAVANRAVDARRGDVRFVYQLELALDESPQQERKRLQRLGRADAVWLEPRKLPEPQPGDAPLGQRPIIAGFGPGGMFAALRLAQFGYRPIVLERGRDVRRRHRDVLQRYYRERDFDESSNLLFGEGGAGTYSDGKLYTRVNDPLCRLVLEIFYQHGADPEILVSNRPHIGSDRLPTICTRLRRRIESLGGEIRFETTLTDLRIVDDDEAAHRRLACVEVTGPGADTPTGERGMQWLDAGPVIVAVGHSARDTIRLLARCGVRIDPKPFQIGVRIEHPQDMVDQRQYGAAAGHGRLSPAEYRLVAKGAACERGDMFSFCMCPGGEILPSNESAGLVVTNGASRAARGGPFANAGLVITMDPRTKNLDALGGLAYQEQWERLAFAATGESYRVPAQRAIDYLARRASTGTLETSFPLGATWTDVRSIIPPEVADALDRALPLLDRKLPGIARGDSIITAPETRASAPIRMVRDDATRESVSVAGLYPVGEGAGYAGGIVSAAVDGIKTADAIIRRYAHPR